MKVFLAVLSLTVASSQSYNHNQGLVRVARQAYPVQAPAPEYGPPANYDFEWLVKDDYSRNDYGHKESRKDQQTQGSYHVALPDGRIQTVTYSVDGYGGYKADVSYSGQAAYPEARPYASPAPAPPAPYKPAPAPAPQPPPPPPPPPAPTATPYRPQPVAIPIALPQLSFQPQPAPAPYRPQPAPYRPQPAPYRPQPIQPYAAGSIQSPTYAQAPSVRQYSFKTVTDAAPIAVEAPVEAPAPVEVSEARAVEPEAPYVADAPEERSAQVSLPEAAEAPETASEAVQESATAESASDAPPGYYRYYY